MPGLALSQHVVRRDNHIGWQILDRRRHHTNGRCFDPSLKIDSRMLAIDVLQSCDSVLQTSTFTNSQNTILLRRQIRRSDRPRGLCLRSLAKWRINKERFS